MKRLIILSMTTCLLAGCGIYSNYSRPNMEVKERYRNVETADTTTIASLSWRELFTDIRLQVLIEQGLQQNTDLRIAHLKVEEAEAVLMNARLSYLPSLTLNPEAGIGRYDGMTSKTYNLNASASWELDIFGKNTNAKQGASEALEGSRDYT
ncbi:TolC family protein, partial [Parabacteroides merdae]|nr:TolC family protein [Parabacteroides merdae]